MSDNTEKPLKPQRQPAGWIWTVSQSEKTGTWQTRDKLWPTNIWILSQLPWWSKPFRPSLSPQTEHYGCTERAGCNFTITMLCQCSDSVLIPTACQHVFVSHLECWASAPALMQLLWLYTKSWRCALRWPQTGRGWSPEHPSCFHLHKIKIVSAFFFGPKHVGRGSVTTVYSGTSMVSTGRTPRRFRCCLKNRQHFPECSQTLPLRV